jgi:hypothetical protein
MTRAVSRASVVLGLFTLLLGAGGASAAYADVTAAETVCAPGNVCVYPNANYRGAALASPRDEPDYTKWSPGSDCSKPTFSDCASSVENAGRQCTVYLWTDVGYKGRYHSLAKGDRVADFSSKTSGYKDPSFNDTVSSHHWCKPK